MFRAIGVITGLGGGITAVDQYTKRPKYVFKHHILPLQENAIMATHFLRTGDDTMERGRDYDSIEGCVKICKDFEFVKKTIQETGQYPAQTPYWDGMTDEVAYNHLEKYRIEALAFWDKTEREFENPGLPVYRDICSFKDYLPFMTLHYGLEKVDSKLNNKPMTSVYTRLVREQNIKEDFTRNFHYMINEAFN